MTKTTARVTLVFICALALGRIAFGHDGPHKVMGTVSAVHEERLEVTATDGKSVSLNVDDKTKVIHGRMAMKVSDIKVGERVVVTASEKKGSDGKATLRALEIRLGAPAPAPKVKK
jgi:hypothetical protein